MEIVKSFKQNEPAQLTKAILIYEGAGTVCTIHPVSEGVIRAGSLLDPKDLLDTLKDEGRGWISPNVVYQKGSTTVKVLRKHRRSLFFTPGTPLSKFNGVDIELPNLLFITRSSSLQVFAFRRFNQENTVLYHSPFWNVYNTGMVCTGGGSPTPEGFFKSAFSHANNDVYLRLSKLYIKAITKFPDSELQKTGQKLEEAINGQAHR